MTDPIRKIAVLGAGTMGAGIAAQAANAGIPVRLLDIVPAGATRRNALAEAALARLAKSEPAAFMAPEAARLIKPGNLEDDLASLADCDWIIEAVIERLDIKQALYARLAAVRKPDAAVSSNTSTIPLALLTEGMDPAMRRHFLITHFFNPPRYMRLLELVAGPETDPAVLARVAACADQHLGKTAIRCPDSPGFIANRLGIFWLQRGMRDAMRLGLTVEEADAVFGKPLGLPKTGLFGLMDLVGIDLAPHLNHSMRQTLPADDAFQAVGQDIPLVARLIAEGRTGRKSGAGFYRMRKSASGKSLEALDLTTGEYRPERRPRAPELDHPGRDLRALLSAPGKLGAFARSVLGHVIAYAATLVPDAATSLADIDEAMRLGYAWKQGPFELADRIGVDWLIPHLEADGIPVPGLLRAASGQGFYKTESGALFCLTPAGAWQKRERAPGVLLLADIKRAGKPVLRNASASLWDIGEGVACFELTGKANTIDPEALALLQKSIDLVAQKFKALVIYTDAANFSMGANLGLAMFAANIAAWSEIEKLVATGQAVYKAMKYAPFPVVAAPAGMALGGGCEIVLHADAIVAHAETYIGLVECGVGLIPAWGGCTEMLARWQAEPALPRGPMPAPAKVFEMVSVATVAKSASDARALHFLRATDRIVMNRDRLLAEAKSHALALVPGYTPPEPPTYALPGPTARTGFTLAAAGFAKRGLATPHDLVVADALAETLSGGDADFIDPITEPDLLTLERTTFMRLVRTPETLARIEHTLTTGRPLRN